MHSYLPANELWQMKPHDFNRWRAENDLLVLFNYFRETLPEFDVWLQTIGLSQHQILTTLNLGNFFNGDAEKVVIRERNSYAPEKFSCIDKSDLQKPQWRTNRALEGRQLDVVSVFTPYFKWIKIRTKTKNPVMWDTRNKYYTNHFFIGGYRNIPPNSRARIWRGPELLKLGEIELPEHISMSEMNLDFADLDGLKIAVGVNGGFTNISCSSLRNLEIKDTSIAFFRFKYCKFEEVHFHNSKIQDFYFFDCSLGDLTISDCTVYKLSFERSTGLPFIQNCDLKDFINYEPGKNNSWEEDAYRLLKNAYNSAGQRKFASEYYYQEQIAHRKNIFNAKRHHKYSSSYPGGRPNSWLEIIKNIKSPLRKPLTIRKLKYYWQYLSKPKYLTALISHKLQWAYLFLDWAIWGHGVKLHRLAFSSSTVMLLYALLYQTLGEQISATPALGPFWDYLYFSMVTFTTLGYGDILPKTTTLRMICGSEAFLGAFMMGLVVAGFANRKAD